MSLDDGEQRASGGGTSSGANDQDGERCRRRKKKESERRERRKMEREIELAFSSDSNEPLPSKHKPSRLKPPNSNSGENIKPDKKTSGSYEVGDDVEARFEGRLKWFSGKVGRFRRSGTKLNRLRSGEGALIPKYILPKKKR